MVVHTRVPDGDVEVPDAEGRWCLRTGSRGGTGNEHRDHVGGQATVPFAAHAGHLRDGPAKLIAEASQEVVADGQAGIIADEQGSPFFVPRVVDRAEKQGDVEGSRGE